MTDDQKQKWLSKDAWSEQETVWLLCGKDYTASNNTPEDGESNDARESLRRAVLMKVLSAVAPIDASAGDRLYGHARFFRPDNVIRWANGKWSDFPFALSDCAPNGIPERTEQHRQTVSDNTLVSTIAALLASWPGGKPPSGKDLEKAASSVGVSVSDDSIRKALRLAHEIAPSLKSA
jgi:hypothetical protein